MSETDSTETPERATLSPSPSSPKSSAAQPPINRRYGGWVIWSKRPHDPSHAPGIIISPRARPPQDVIQYALDLPTPPASPVPAESHASEQGITQEGEANTSKELTQSPPEHADVPSSSATETTPTCSTAPDTPMPGSPVSTNTSLSVAAVSPDRGRASQSPKVSTLAVPSIEEKSTPEELTSPPADISISQPAPTSVPAPSPAPKSVPKSWASLLRSSDAASSSKTSNSLPTSSVVGFSIPATSAPESSIPVPPSKKPELLALLNSGPAGPANAPKIRPRGLINNGNMCFANAVLQVLVYCPPFWRLFTELGRFLGENGTQEEKTKIPLVDATVQFLKEFQPKASVQGKGKGVERDYGYREDQEEDGFDSFLPTHVYDAMKEKKQFDHMRGGHQEDAEEFFGFYLDTLEEELLSIVSSISPATSKPNAHAHVEEREEAAPPPESGWLEVGRRNKTVVTRTIKTAESPITRIFGGKFRSTLRAPQQKDSVIVEDWRSLRLDIQREQIYTIKDALAYISAPQSVQVTSPARPGVVIDASQLVQIEALPPILVLHMKRFLYDMNAGGVAKVGKQVSFGPELEIGPDIMAPGRKVQPTRYKLFGVLYHHGLSASGGHYTLDVLHPNRDMSTKPREAWIRIDDELVSDVRAEDVFGGLERDDRCAYLLFYRRLGGPVARTQ
ncbi:hypothetical protein SERLA73DRAFT_162553 [Serpula lacrymans var. lacrymans S7.3]|uniref:Ubiquitin carboxyl-terminal hydrolase n=1 Tax=Serpula lacrymans var. lacrymans (strain S7.3) TaxID=936435 RepID=F8Q8F9_SERL3|nr:hypothetical protein SERLA73DRAFT_162553 [Serpula lacrymans var. lacrymans S7.3]